MRAVRAVLRGLSMSDVADAYETNRSTVYRWVCLLYTSDAADERSSVDLGGRRIIKKKKNNTHTADIRKYKTIQSESQWIDASNK